MKKFFTYITVIATLAWSLGIAAVAPAALAAYTPVDGDIVKTATNPAVYYVTGDGVRHLFSNRVTFGSWLPNFNGLKVISQSEFEALTPGNNVIARPGSLIKFDNESAVYAVAPNNALYAIGSGDAAAALYGSAWASKILIIQSSFRSNYPSTAAGVLTATSNLPDGSLFQYAGTDTTTYYVQNGQKRPLATDAFTANGFRDSMIVKNVPATMTFTSGSSITSREDGIAKIVSAGSSAYVPSGNVTVSLASNNPTAGAFPVPTTSGHVSQVPFLRINITAGNADAVVTGLNVYRGGLSNDNDINNVYLMDGSVVVATNIGLSNGKAIFSQPGGLFTVKAGTTKTITIAADVNYSAAGHAIAWSINAATDIVATNQTIGGSFPINGTAMSAVQVTNPDLATLTVTPIGTGASVNAGTQGYLAGEFSFQAANSAVSIKSIKLTETGTINAASDLTNIKLMNGATQIGAVAPALSADGTVVFDLSSNPLQITAGQTANLFVYADVVGGVNRNFRFTIQRAYDVVATDMTYGVGSTISLSATPANGTQTTVSYGTLLVQKSADSPTGSVAANATNQTIGKFSVTANGEAVRITALTYGMSFSSATGTLVFDNLKLVDDQGTQIGTTVRSTAVVETSVPTTYTALTGLNYIVPANTTRVLYVKADVVTAGTSLTANLSGITAQGYTSLADASAAGTVTGNPLTINATPLAAALNNSVGAITAVENAPAVRVASFNLSAGQSEGANVNTITLTTKTVASKFSSLTVKVNGTQVGSVYNTLASASPYTFSVSSPINIAAGTTAVVDVYANTLGSTYGAAPVVELTSVSATGALTNSVLSIVAKDGQNVTVGTGGALTFDSLTNISSQFVSAGVTGVKLGTYTFKADNKEAINLTQVNIKDTGAQASTLTDLTNIKLMNGTTQVGTTAGSLSTAADTAFVINAGSAGAVVAQNGYITLDIVADVNNASVITSGDAHTISVSGVSYQGASSGNPDTIADGSITDSATVFTVYRTNLIATQGSVSVDNNIYDGKTVASFTFTAGTGGPAKLASTTLQAVGAAVSTTAPTTMKIYNGSTLVATQVVTGTTATLVNFSPITVSAGGSVTLTVKADLTTAGYSASSPAKSYGVNLTTYTWGDGSAAGNVFTPDPSISLPVSGPGIAF